jgi:hypothetical protein
MALVLVQPLHYLSTDAGRMPTVHRFRTKYRICVVPGDHPRPHFHLEGPDCDATITIDTLELDRGDGPAVILKEAREWAAENQDVLITKWNEINERDD